jgi:hypothetical protein
VARNRCRPCSSTSVSDSFATTCRPSDPSAASATGGLAATEAASPAAAAARRPSPSCACTSVRLPCRRSLRRRCVQSMSSGGLQGSQTLPVHGRNRPKCGRMASSSPWPQRGRTVRLRLAGANANRRPRYYRQFQRLTTLASQLTGQHPTGGVQAAKRRREAWAPVRPAPRLAAGGAAAPSSPELGPDVPPLTSAASSTPSSRPTGGRTRRPWRTPCSISCGPGMSG